MNKIKNTTIGENCKIWHYVNLYDSQIGNNVMIASFVEIGGSIIGNDCAIQGGVFIPPGTKIGNKVFLGPKVTITNDKYPKAHAKDYKLDGVTIKDGAAIGAGAVILPGVTIGKNALVGAGAVVIRDVEDYGIYVGNPAKKIGDRKDEYKKQN